MPLKIEAIQSIEIGSIHSRRLDAPIQLDSYQDDQSECLKQDWIDSIQKRKTQIEQQLANSSENSTDNVEFLEELLHLAEEHDLAECPPMRSGLPGFSFRQRKIFSR